ncbi:tail fiber protein [Bradyrhizobium genomosp. I (2014)]|uniref:tail fiber protein n=1 Tax=Bradyrhizobium genomosp. I (2014) TaxID=2683269 RepID=UPI0004B72D8A|nr:tail fiber protein [Bradyrhizobium sp. CCBAU 43298]
MTLYKWSQTASADATADSTINWSEGQAPSSVNDSARAMMAAIAKYRDDVAGAIVTTGTSTAYAANTYQVFQSVSQLNGQVIAFTPHATNGATVTLNVDGLGAKPLWSAPSVELPAGVLVQGTPYAALYNASDAAFYLHGFFANPYSIPIGGSIDFWGSTAPNSSFVLMYGQAISRTTYSTLFSMVSTAYGSGDGSTTFNVPDLRGRVTAGKDDMGGSAASRLTSVGLGVSGAILGNAGATESYQLQTSNLPPYTPSGTNIGGASNFQFSQISVGGTGGSQNIITTISNSGGGVVMNTNFTQPTFTGTAQGGSSTAFSRCQPTIISNKLLRII